MSSFTESVNQEFQLRQQVVTGSVLEEELHEKRAMFRDFLTSRVQRTIIVLNTNHYHYLYLYNYLFIFLGSLGR